MDPWIHESAAGAAAACILSCTYMGAKRPPLSLLNEYIQQQVQQQVQQLHQQIHGCMEPYFSF